MKDNNPGLARPRRFSTVEQDLIAHARLIAARRFPYLARALFALRPLAAEGLGTFAVDASWRVYIDPEQLLVWTPGETAAVLVHELAHVLRDHAGRSRTVVGPDDPTAKLVWNLACDCAINDDIERATRADGGSLGLTAVALPAPLLPSTLGLRTGGIEEEYFDDLTSKTDAVHLVLPATCGGGSGVGPGDDPLSQAADALGIRGLVPGAALVLREQVRSDTDAPGARSLGGHAGIQGRGVDLVGYAALPWRLMLRRLVRAAARPSSGWHDLTYSRVDRRAGMDDAFIRPGLRSRDFTVAVVVDTSASMSPDDLGRALSELEGVLRAQRRSRVVVYACDAAVTRLPDVGTAAEFALHLRGGGGTDMAAAIEVAADPSARRDRPDLVIVMTDGWTPWPVKPARCTVLAVLLESIASPSPPAMPPDFVESVRLVW